MCEIFIIASQECNISHCPSKTIRSQDMKR